MTERSEATVAAKRASGAINGLVCAFALLIDALETNGALVPAQYESILSNLLRRTEGSASADTDVLRQILELLKTQEPPPLTVIDGGKS